MGMSVKGIFVFRYSQTFSEKRFRLPEKVPAPQAASQDGNEAMLKADPGAAGAECSLCPCESIGLSRTN